MHITPTRLQRAATDQRWGDVLQQLVYGHRRAQGIKNQPLPPVLIADVHGPLSAWITDKAKEAWASLWAAPQTPEQNDRACRSMVELGLGCFMCTNVMSRHTAADTVWSDLLRTHVDQATAIRACAQLWPTTHRGSAWSWWPALQDASRWAPGPAVDQACWQSAWGHIATTVAVQAASDPAAPIRRIRQSASSCLAQLHLAGVAIDWAHADTAPLWTESLKATNPAQEYARLLGALWALDPATAEPVFGVFGAQSNEGPVPWTPETPRWTGPESAPETLSHLAQRGLVCASALAEVISNVDAHARWIKTPAPGYDDALQAARSALSAQVLSARNPARTPLQM